jgi:L-proline amide hydrolase
VRGAIEQRLTLVPELGTTWCRIVGDQTDRVPVVVLHGGPGYNSAYLQPFEELADAGRQVISYDQIGAGRSVVAHEHYDRPGTFTIELFRRELAALRSTLDLDRVYLLGQSWGCMLALEHVLNGGTGVCGLVLESGLASMEEWDRETLRLRSKLPAEVLSVLDTEQAAGRMDGAAFKAAYAVWEQTHILRLDPPPAWELDALGMFEDDHRVYDLITGGAEFPTGGAIGEFATWDVRPRLGEIDAPTLLLSGRFDEATPAVVGTLHDGIAGSQWHVLEQSSHSCHSEQSELTVSLVADFLERVDAATIGSNR